MGLTVSGRVNLDVDERLILRAGITFTGWGCQGRHTAELEEIIEQSLCWALERDGLVYLEGLDIHVLCVRRQNACYLVLQLNRFSSDGLIVTCHQIMMPGYGEGKCSDVVLSSLGEDFFSAVGFKTLTYRIAG